MIEDDRWRQAEIVYEQVEAGKSQRQFAKDVGQASSTISVLYRIWDKYGSASEVTATVTFEQARRMIETGTDDPSPSSSTTRKARPRYGISEL